MFTIFVTILVSILRLSIITGIKICKLPNYKITSTILFIISAAIFSPIILTRQIIGKEVLILGNASENNNSSYFVYSTVKNNFSKSPIGQFLVVAVSLFRGNVCAAIIIIINLTSKIILTRKMNKSARDLNLETSKSFKLTLRINSAKFRLIYLQNLIIESKFSISKYFSRLFKKKKPTHNVILVSYKKCTSEINKVKSN